MGACPSCFPTTAPTRLDPSPVLVAGTPGAGKARPILLERATVMVWLDLPVRTVMRQVVWRTLMRRLRRERIWGTSMEPPLHTFFTDRNHIVRWAWRTRHQTAEHVDQALERRPELPVLQVRSHAEAQDAVWRLAEAAGR